MQCLVIMFGRNMRVATVVVDVSCRSHPADAAARFKQWGHMVVFVNETAVVDVSDM
jgi:hypothetical protein